MNLFQAVTSSSKTISGVYRVGRETLCAMASIKPIARQFSYRAFLHGAGVVALILIFSGYRASGIEGLTISIQNGTNVVLGWPSATNETYLIQYASTLSTNMVWQGLTNYYPASTDTNWTTFVIEDAIIPATDGTNGSDGSDGSGPPSPDDMAAVGAVASQLTALAPGDTTLPPSPWLPQTLPYGAILKLQTGLTSHLRRLFKHNLHRAQ
jgi:hypothetical protein